MTTELSKFETPLCEMAYRHRADKCPQLNNNFTPFYYNLLKDKRESFKKILELGIGSKRVMHFIKNYKVGASLYMWRDFFPNAQIYGIDINPEVIFEYDRIKTFLCDASKQDDLKNLIEQIGSDIDLFIDDGSHHRWHQIFTCQTLMPLLKKDVIYVIEDVKYIRRVPKALSTEYDCEVVVLGPNHSSRVVIVRNKKENIVC